MWMFALKYWKPLAVIGVALTLMASCIWYGQMRYREGYNAATVHWQEVVRMAQMKAKEERKDVKEKVMRLSDPDIDSELVTNQWMRRDEDY